MPNEYRIYEFRKPEPDWRLIVQRIVPVLGILLVCWVLFTGVGASLSALTQKLIIYPIFIISLVLHEMSHAYMAVFLGDPTPRATGRLSFNPMKHLDLWGTILFIFCGFGWAKPVQVNSSYFKNPNRAMVSVGLAGPLSNMLIAILAAFAYKLSLAALGNTSAFNYYFRYICQFTTLINVRLAIFNLIPVPPLDGSRFIHYLLPARFQANYYKLQQYSFIIFVLLFVYGGTMIFPIVNNLVKSIWFGIVQ